MKLRFWKREIDVPGDLALGAVPDVLLLAIDLEDCFLVALGMIVSLTIHPPRP
jgi:hypothetical protein